RGVQISPAAQSAPLGPVLVHQDLDLPVRLYCLPALASPSATHESRQLLLLWQSVLSRVSCTRFGCSSSQDESGNLQVPGSVSRRHATCRRAFQHYSYGYLYISG